MCRKAILQILRKVLGRQWTDELQAKAESVARAHDGGQARREGHIELNLKQVARVQENARVQGHAALADLRPAAFDHGGRKPLGREHLHRQINRHSFPAARRCGIRHSRRNDRLSAKSLQITKVKWQTAITTEDTKAHRGISVFLVSSVVISSAECRSRLPKATSCTILAVSSRSKACLAAILILSLGLLAAAEK